MNMVYMKRKNKHEIMQKENVAQQKQTWVYKLLNQIKLLCTNSGKPKIKMNLNRQTCDIVIIYHAAESLNSIYNTLLSMLNKILRVTRHFQN